jgi:hypothetical protein
MFEYAALFALATKSKHNAVIPEDFNELAKWFTIKRMPSYVTAAPRIQSYAEKAME